MPIDVQFPGNLGQVDTIAKLRAVPTSGVDAETVYIAMDVGRTYSFDFGSLLNDDGINVIRPNDRTPLQAGRFIYLVDGFAPGNPGAPGPAGPADNTYTTLAALLASDPTRKSARLVPQAGETEPAGNFNYINGSWVRQSADGVNHQYAETGSRPRRWAETRSKQVELSGFTGADPTGGNDSYVALQAAIAVALQRKGELIIDSAYRISLNGRAPIKPTGPLTIRGAQHRSSNVPDSNQHRAALYFDQDAPESIVVDDTQLTIDRCAIIGPSRVSTYPGIKTVGTRSALRLCGGAVVQAWQIGVKYESGYYHRIRDATIADCITGLLVSGPGGSLPPIYNLQVTQLKVTAPGRDVANTTCLSIFGGSQVSVAQSSFESFTGNGIVIQDASLDIFSSYFEGFGGWNVFLSRYAHIVAFGNRVYLNEGANRWISVEGGSTPGVHVVARGNQFVVPSNADPAIVYSVRSDDPEAVSDIDGGVLLATPGPNVQHLNASFFAGAGPAALRGNHSIRFPFGNARYARPVSTTPVNVAPAQGAVGTPDEAMLLPFALGGFAGDDPSALRPSWGNHPMMMAFHKSNAAPDGQWEKVGLLLPYRAPPADAAGAVAWITQFVTDLRAQGVMRNP